MDFILYYSYFYEFNEVGNLIRYYVFQNIEKEIINIEKLLWLQVISKKIL